VAYKLIKYEAKRFTTGLTDVLTTIYRNGTVVESGVATEQATTGVYFYPYSSTTAGSYLAYTDSATQPQPKTEAWRWVSFDSAVDTLSTSVTYLHVKWRLGDIEANLGTGSANIISTAISGAQAEVDEIVGRSATTPLEVFAIADLAAGRTVDTFLGRDDLPVSNQRIQMAANLKENAYRMLKAEGHEVRYSKVN